MNKLTYMTITVLTTLLAACSNSDEQLTENRQTLQEASSQAVRFSTYTGRSAATRGGAAGPIDDVVLQQSDYGFGVFAYKTGLDTYAFYRTMNAVERRYPNFMYNEHIQYDATAGKWDYAEPVNTKYWPNEISGGTNGGQVSFFAYAPYVAEGAKSSEATISGQPVATPGAAGIMALSTPTFNGGAAGDVAGQANSYSDPYVRYKIAQQGNEVVDLLWGTQGDNTGVNVDGSVQNSGPSSLSYPDQYTDGSAIPAIHRPNFPMNADLTKQKTDGTVHLLFKHALARIGGSYLGTDDGADDNPATPTNGLMVVLDIDKDGQTSGGSLQPYAGGTGVANTPYNTKVTINEIVLEADRQLNAAGRTSIVGGTDVSYDDATYTAQLYNTGLLNLVTGVWSQQAFEAYGTGVSTHQQSIVPSSGNATIDAAEAGILHANIAEPANYTTTAYTQERFEELPIGVTTVPKNVYASDAQPFVFIPGSMPIVTITVDYTVRTYDTKLADNYSEVRQRITKRLFILDEVQLNKQYNILIHLGLTSVKFTASVSDWTISGTGVTGQTDPTSPSDVLTSSEDVEHVYLPVNVN